MEQQAGARDHHPAMVHLSRNAYGTILRQAYQTLNMVGAIIIHGGKLHTMGRATHICIVRSVAYRR